MAKKTTSTSTEAKSSSVKKAPAKSAKKTPAKTSAKNKQPQPAPQLKIVRNDEWLSPFEPAIAGRHQHVLDKMNELTNGGKQKTAPLYPLPPRIHMISGTNNRIPMSSVIKSRI